MVKQVGAKLTRSSPKVGFEALDLTHPKGNITSRGSLEELRSTGQEKPKPRRHKSRGAPAPHSCFTQADRICTCAAAHLFSGTGVLPAWFWSPTGFAESPDFSPKPCLE